MKHTSSDRILEEPGRLSLENPPWRHLLWRLLFSALGIVLLSIAVMVYRDFPNPVAWIEPRWLANIAGMLLPGPSHAVFTLVYTGFPFLGFGLLAIGHSSTTEVVHEKITITHRMYSLPYFQIIIAGEDLQDLKLAVTGTVRRGGKVIPTSYSIKAQRQIGKDATLIDNLVSKEEGNEVYDRVMKCFYGI